MGINKIEVDEALCVVLKNMGTPKGTEQSVFIGDFEYEGSVYNIKALISEKAKK